ncbi:hypothetical protein PISMIDRAFT_687737, partial [Pisolithus microcarpus 441]
MCTVPIPYVALQSFIRVSFWSEARDTQRLPRERIVSEPTARPRHSNACPPTWCSWLRTRQLEQNGHKKHRSLPMTQDLRPGLTSAPDGSQE